jgi:hypothetical protein
VKKENVVVNRTILSVTLCLSLAGLIGCGEGDLGPAQDLGAIAVKPPKQWTVETPTSSMRKAQYRLTKAEGDAIDAELIIYYFGQNQGGGVEDNIERWYGQFQQPDGSASKDKARVDKRTVSGMPVTLVDVGGTYAPGPMNPMMPHGPEPKPGYRMLAAIVETPQGAYFFKLTGPGRTVEQWRKSFDGFIDRVQKK